MTPNYLQLSGKCFQQLSPWANDAHVSLNATLVVDRGQTREIRACALATTTATAMRNVGAKPRPKLTMRCPEFWLIYNNFVGSTSCLTKLCLFACFVQRKIHRRFSSLDLSKTPLSQFSRLFIDKEILLKVLPQIQRRQWRQKWNLSTDLLRR